ncbi:MAG: UbiA family prenyltransferase [Paracoccaceae bacterium]
MPDQHTLVVDLDNSLLKTDLLYETFFAGLAARPFATLWALFALVRGRAAFKAALTDVITPTVETMPRDENVLEYIRRERENGSRIALVSASDERLVQAVADSVGGFDEVHGSRGGVNLGGRAKAAMLIEKFGEGRFDYIGDAPRDLAIWKAARRAVTVGAGSWLKRRVGAVSKDAVHLSPPARGLPLFRPYLKAIRPHQWIKNVLVSLPILAAQNPEIETWLGGLAAFVAFSLTASSVYLLNDLLDLPDDRAHPRKCGRPFASGAVPLSHGLVLAPMLLLSGILVGLAFTPTLFLVVLALYYSGTLAYSMLLKRRLVIDICALGGLYALRVLGGAAAGPVKLSPWMLAFSAFLFLALAATKRQTELVDGLRTGREQAAGRAYKVEDLPIVAMMALGSGFNAVLVLALYISNPAVKRLYPFHEALWAACPVLLYWITRMVMLAHRGRMTDDPIIFALKDKVGLLAGAAIVAVALVAKFGEGLRF